MSPKDKEFTLANEVAGGLALGLKLLIFLAREIESRFTCNYQDLLVVVAFDGFENLKNLVANLHNQKKDL